MKPTETILAALRWRYATKQFDPSKKIDEATWQALEEALVLSPSSFGLQPWKFFVVNNPELRQQLVPHSWGQTQMVEASHLVIFAVKHPVTADDVRKHILRTAEVRSIPVEQLSGFEAVVNGGNFKTESALLGVDTCPMEGLDPAGYDKVLGLEGSGYFTVAACPAGYRAETDKYAKLPKVRFEKSQVIQYI